MSDEWIEEELAERRQVYLEAEQRITALETEFRDAERNLANAEVANMKTEQRVYNSVMADLSSARRELEDLEGSVESFEAWASPLGQLARAAYRTVQYDYDEEECYPGVVAALEARLKELGLKLVES